MTEARWTLARSSYAAVAGVRSCSSLLTALYAAVSIQQYNRMDSFIFDLGFFESLIRDYAHGHLPRMPLTDTTPASLHFSPALALLAPWSCVWTSPIAVLLTQAVLVAVGVVPLMRAAGPGLDGRGWWRSATASLRASRALIGFDFHEVALGRPAARVQHGGDGARRPSRRRALGAAAPAGQGGPRPHASRRWVLVVFLRGSRRWGMVTMVVGAVSLPGASLLWVLPAIQGVRRLRRRSTRPTGPADALRTLVDGADIKSRTVLFLLIPTGLLALRSPMLLLVALPTFGWRFVSDRFTYWEPWYQYDAVLVPIAVAAMIEGARLLHGRIRAGWVWRPPSSAPSRWCRSRSRSRRSGRRRLLATRRPAPRRSTRLLDRDPGRAAGSPPPTPSARGSRCAPTSTWSGTPIGARRTAPAQPRSSTRWSGSRSTPQAYVGAGPGLEGLRSPARQWRVQGGRGGRRACVVARACGPGAAASSVPAHGRPDLPRLRGVRRVAHLLRLRARPTR